jgi:cyclophilin family peptidyl-prolyl cis-trans isomerase/HEAT repeat protein
MKAVLLSLVDRQLYEPVIVRAGLQGGVEVRRATAVALGRIGSPDGLESLYALLLDDDVEVRREAAFAVGEVMEAPELVGAETPLRRAAARLLAVVDDPDREVGSLAVEALGKGGVSVVTVGEALAPLGDLEAWARLLPALYRFHEEASVSLAADALATDDADLHTWAAFALTRDPLPSGLASVRSLLADPDPRVRAWGARAVGRIGDGSDLVRLRPVLDAAEEGPVIQALRAARTLVSDGRGAAPADWRGRLLDLLADPRPGVRVTALDAASAWLLDDEIGAALVAVVEAPELSPWERGTALLALATGGDPRAEGLAADASRADEPVLRARAAEALGILGARGLVAMLAGDPEARVRQAAWSARLALEPQPAVARAGLADDDSGVRTAVLGWLGDHPVLPVAELPAALAPAAGRGLPPRTVEERLSTLDALVARAEAEAAERDAVVGLLLEVTESGGYPERVRAAGGLAALGLPRPSPGAIETHRSAAVYRDVLLQAAAPRTVEVATDRGVFRVRLACPRAPLTCVNFLQLAGQGFFDGLAFHRVVPDFVVQGGDPRGDGWGGPGYTVRDEINRLRYRRGVVGMALAGPDTGGSQFFVTLSPQPHLDGGYTAFGEVVAGMEVLDRIRQGDRIVSIREIE